MPSCNLAPTRHALVRAAPVVALGAAQFARRRCRATRQKRFKANSATLTHGAGHAVPHDAESVRVVSAFLREQLAAER